jgi:hypothetical protein
MPPRFSAGSCCIIKKGCIPAIIKEAKGKKRWLVQLVDKHGASKGTSIIKLTSQQFRHRKHKEFHPMVADDDSSKNSSLPVKESQDSDEQPRANDSPTQVRLETSFDGGVETTLIEEENGDDDNNPYSPVAQGQAGIDDNFDSDGSSYSFRAVPGSDEEDLIQNTDANESLNEKTKTHRMRSRKPSLQKSKIPTWNLKKIFATTLPISKVGKWIQISWQWAKELSKTMTSANENGKSISSTRTRSWQRSGQSGVIHQRKPRLI